MRIYNLSRGGGKSTRLLYVSEFTRRPILCANENQKSELLRKSRVLNLKIPMPVTVKEFQKNSPTSLDGVLVDEVMMVLQELINVVASNKVDILAATMSNQYTSMSNTILREKMTASDNNEYAVEKG
ncbi:MAG TPA: hypothetical protein DCW90_02665 [Lachnospiraceae bacterium]|nr:hypothetical protein [Lachnospiraceae bacterium]